MALFKRSTLKEKGLNDEQVDFIMAEAARALANDYMLKSDAQAQIDAAKAETPATVDVKASAEYVALQSERDSVQAEFDAYKAKETARHSEAFKGVKDKFFDEVYAKVDKEKDIPEQLKTIKADYEEYFEPEETPPADNKPTFGTPASGAMPKGEKGTSFATLWGLERK